MNIDLKDIGVIEHTKLDLKNLTVIFGDNNTGKSTIASACYGLFLTLQSTIAQSFLKKAEIKTLINTGKLQVNLSRFKIAIKTACDIYSKNLSYVFSSQSDLFKFSKISLQINEIKVQNGFNRHIKNKHSSLSVQLVEDKLNFTLFEYSKINIKFLELFIYDSLQEIFSEILSQYLPTNTYMVSNERTGIVLFRSRLSFSESLLQKLKNSDVNTQEKIINNLQSLSLPITRQSEFINCLNNVSKKQSFIKIKHPELIQKFIDILGGEFYVDSFDCIYFKPINSDAVIPIAECSGSTRSLLDIYFYLTSIAQLNDLFIFEKPELQLSTNNQRKLAQIFAMISNLGIKVLITTQSECFIKELNLLVRLNSNNEHKNKNREELGYCTDELIDAKNFNVYITEKLETQKYTLTQVPVFQDVVTLSIFNQSEFELNRLVNS